MSQTSPGDLAAMACLIELGAPKAGNVHPGADFADTTCMDFAVSAVAIAPAMDRAAETGVGRAVLDAVIATREKVGRNTNLGMILLLAPLCAADGRRQKAATLRESLRGVLAGLGENDARDVYEAIRLAQPGGLGKVERGDVSGGAVMSLREAMGLAASRDAVARQYMTDYGDVFLRVVPSLVSGVSGVSGVTGGLSLGEAVVRAHLEQMSREPDSLIRRKCGDEIASESSRRAASVLALDWPRTVASRAAFDELDRWLRAEGNKRNPGTSADLIAAGLYVALSQGMIDRPAEGENPWMNLGLE